LPAWYDTYDFAQRVEMLGIGIYGSRSVTPKVDAVELSRALITITSPKNAAGKLIRERARELGKVMQKYGGRKLAAEKILELTERNEFSGKT
jgi:UDP:flavonoid glycosyltransferase YjiC (YdhE family)